MIFFLISVATRLCVSNHGVMLTFDALEMSPDARLGISPFMSRVVAF